MVVVLCEEHPGSAQATGSARQDNLNSKKDAFSIFINTHIKTIFVHLLQLTIPSFIPESLLHIISDNYRRADLRSLSKALVCETNLYMEIKASGQSITFKITMPQHIKNEMGRDHST